jgi:hypothetical protein
MPEDIETSLSWPDKGLHGVPESAAEAEVPVADGAGGAEARAEAGADAGAASADANNPATPLYDIELGDGISTIARSIDEFSTSTTAIRSFLDDPSGANDEEVASKMADALRGAELALIRLEQAATDVSGKLESIDGALGHRLAGLSAQLDFQTRDLPDLDVALPPHAAFKGGLPGITPTGTAMDPATGLPVYSGGTVTWPPQLPPRKKTLWTRLARPVVAIPLLLVAAVLIAGATYKIVKHETRTQSPTVAALQGTKGFGSVKVISATSCQAGTSTATMQLASAQYKNGEYFIGITGTMSNAATTHLTGVRVTWSVTYADGYIDTQSAPVNDGLSIPARSTKAWTALESHSEGTVPPVSAQVIRIAAQQPQPACSG